MEKVQLFSLVLSVVVLFVVIELVRDGRLKENYSVLWICTAFAGILLAVFRVLIDWLSELAGIHYTPSAFFLVAILFLMLITMQFSVAISKLHEHNKVLAQEMALLRLRLEELQSKAPE